jgi:uncharacterized protein YjiS (DUF1127 family)
MLRQDCIDSISMPVANSGTSNSWKMWISTGVNLLVSDLARIVEVLALWQRRSTERAKLRDFDDRLLNDSGISRAQALREAGKPFWRA